MSPLDIVFVPGDIIVPREQDLIGGPAQQELTVTGLACIRKVNVKTAMLVNSVMEGTSHLLQISVQLATSAQ